MTRTIQAFFAGVLALSAAAFFAFTAPVALLLEGDGCPKPGSIFITNVSDTSATIDWIFADGVTAVDIQWREFGSDEWTTLTSVLSPNTIELLSPCTLYEVRLRSICNTDSSNYTEPRVFETDSCCRIPTGIRVEFVEDTTAQLSWDRVVASEYVQYRYRPTGRVDWDTDTTSATSVFLDDLEACTAYDFQVRSICGPQDTTGYSERIHIFVEGCGTCNDADYCISRGVDATEFWIDSVSFANCQLQTGSNDGYLGFNSEKVLLERGRRYNLFVAPGFADEVCPQYFRVWIDLDLDGAFNDSTELVLDTIDQSGIGVATVVELVDTLGLDGTRMRIGMKPATETDTIPPDPCEIYSFGEVEDYCVTIDDVCPVAENLDTMDVTENSALIVWDVNEKALGFLYQQKKSSDGEFSEDPVIVTDTLVNLTGLEKCTSYDFKLIQVCIQDTTEQILTFETKCPNAVRDIGNTLGDVAVFPNPFTSNFTIKLTPNKTFSGTLAVVNVSGQILIIENLEIPAGQTLRHEVNGMNDAPTGMYFVVLRSDQGVSTQKVIKY